jgi:hypothetical protein
LRETEAKVNEHNMIRGENRQKMNMGKRGTRTLRNTDPEYKCTKYNNTTVKQEHIPLFGK